jgi:hypothetical protein
VTDLRRDLLNGIKNSRCSSCWDIEAAGGQGPRTRIDAFVNFLKTNNVWPGLNWDQIAQKLEQLSQQDVEKLINLRFPKKIELSLGNTCDLKCVYCNHHYSSQWAAELLKHDEIKAHEIEQELPRSKDTAYEDIWWAWFEQHAGTHTEMVNFIGGEPLIIDKFYAYCNRIIDFYGCNPGIGTKELTVVTNFNTPERFLDRFLEICGRVIHSDNLCMDVNVSCESLGARTEFIRSGSDWQLMLHNIDRLFDFLALNDTAHRITFSLQIALNALCISDLPNFFRWVIELQRRTMRPINLRPNQVVYPSWCNPHILPVEYVKYIEHSIQLVESEYHKVGSVHKYHPWGSWNDYIRFLETIKAGMANPRKDVAARKRFAVSLDTLIQRRDLDFAATFPEMQDFYHLCRSIP